MSYSTSTTFDRQAFRRNKNFIKHMPTKNGLGPISRTLVLMMIVGVSALLYLTQVTKTSNYSYQINELETRRSQLKQRNQELSIEIARLRSISNIQQSKQAAALTDQGNVSFVD
jgi:cell division protein FtsB